MDVNIDMSEYIGYGDRMADDVASAGLMARLSDPCCVPLGEQAMSPDDAEAAAALLGVLADPVRLRLLSLIATRPDGVCGCDLVGELDRSQPTVSHHLKVLTEAGLLERERRGRWIWYTAAQGSLVPLQQLLAI